MKLQTKQLNNERAHANANSPLPIAAEANMCGICMQPDNSNSAEPTQDIWQENKV